MFALRLLPVYGLCLLSPVQGPVSPGGPAEPCVREISFQHLGESDKPLFALVLSTNARQQVALEDEEHGSLVQVTDKELTAVARAIAHFNATHEAEPRSWQYGTFRASFTDSCRRTRHWRYSHRYSKAFFLRLDSLATQFRPQAQAAIHTHVSDWLHRL